LMHVQLCMIYLLRIHPNNAPEAQLALQSLWVEHSSLPTAY